MGLTEPSPDNPVIDVAFRVILIVLYVPTIWLIVLTIGLIGGIAFFILDALAMLWPGGDSRADGMLADWAERLFKWPFEQLNYLVGTDPGGFPLLP